MKPKSVRVNMKRFICMEPNEIGWATREQAQEWADAPHNKGKHFRVVEVTDCDAKACARAEQERHDELEAQYAAGMEMARRLLRLQLGLAVPGDRT